MTPDEYKVYSKISACSDQQGLRERSLVRERRLYHDPIFHEPAFRCWSDWDLPLPCSWGECLTAAAAARISFSCGNTSAPFLILLVQKQPHLILMSGGFGRYAIFRIAIVLIAAYGILIPYLGFFPASGFFMIILHGGSAFGVLFHSAGNGTHNRIRLSYVCTFPWGTGSHGHLGEQRP